MRIARTLMILAVMAVYATSAMALSGSGGSIGPTSNPQVNSLGVGTAPDGVAGDIKVSAGLVSTGNLGIQASSGNQIDLTILQAGGGDMTLNNSGISARHPNFPVVVSACGGTTTAAAGSFNNGGRVTAAGAATSCTLAFGNGGFITDAFCTVTDLTGARALWISGQSKTGFTVNGLTALDTFQYTCFGAN